MGVNGKVTGKQMSGEFPSKNGDSNARRNALDALSDEQLMLEVQRGDGDAFTVIFDRYNRLVLTVALRIVHDVGEAQEVTQSVFLNFIAQREDLTLPEAHLKCTSLSPNTRQ